jgi:hypothetical protein
MEMVLVQLYWYLPHLSYNGYFLNLNALRCAYECCTLPWWRFIDGKRGRKIHMSQTTWWLNFTYEIVSWLWLINCPTTSGEREKPQRCFDFREPFFLVEEHYKLFHTMNSFVTLISKQFVDLNYCKPFQNLLCSCNWKYTIWLRCPGNNKS